MRVYVRIGPGNQELLEELEKVPPKMRASRLRALATLGLAFVQGAPPPRDLEHPVDAPDTGSDASSNEPSPIPPGLGNMLK